MSETRIYVVTGQGLRPRLVRASHKSMAIRHVADAMMTAAVATHNDLETYMAKDRLPVEQAGKAAPADAGGFVNDRAVLRAAGIVAAARQVTAARKGGGADLAEALDALEQRCAESLADEAPEMPS